MMKYCNLWTDCRMRIGCNQNYVDPRFSILSHTKRKFIFSR